jgi:hypothetical protein
MDNSNISTSTSNIWYQITESCSQSFKNTCASKISVSPSADVFDFVEAVKTKNNELSLIKSVDLLVYKNKETFERRNAKEEPLKFSCPISGLGRTEEEAVIVVINMIWFQLTDSDSGKPFKNTGAIKMFVSPSASVADFLDAVHEKNSSILIGIVSSQLHVLKNKEAFEKRNVEIDKEEPLEVDFALNGLGTSKKDALIVVTPYSAGKKHYKLIFT